MPWKEIIVDNHQEVFGKSPKKDKALIMLFRGKQITFRVTARYHDGRFKYYVDCDEAEMYEECFATVKDETRESAMRLAIEKIKRTLGGRGSIISIVDLNTAEKELDIIK